MPQQTVYIRKADMDKWKALENKAAFISKHLNKQTLEEGKVINLGDLEPEKVFNPYTQKWEERIYE